MELLKLLLSCCLVHWVNSAAVLDAAEGRFPAAAARLLQHIRMPAERVDLVRSVLTDLENIFQPRFPGCKAALFGSMAMGLAIAESDVDVCMTFRNRTEETLAQLVLEASDIMLQHPDLFQVIRVIQVIPRGKSPILTARHLPTGFIVDVNSFENYNGVMNSKLVQYLMNVDDRARDLVLILKHWARVHKITGHRMLPSYGIVTMGIFFLQQKGMLPTVASLQKKAQKFIVNDWSMGFLGDKFVTRNDESLCEILGGFFEYYNQFDYNNYMASPFVGHPVKIDLFKDLDTVPKEFETYKRNVRSNITQPLRLKIPVVQDSFEHNVNLAYRIDIPPGSIFVTSIQHAAKKFQEGCSGYLEAILAT